MFQRFVIRPYSSGRLNEMPLGTLFWPGKNLEVSPGTAAVQFWLPSTGHKQLKQMSSFNISSDDSRVVVGRGRRGSFSGDRELRVRNGRIMG